MFSLFLMRIYLLFLLGVCDKGCVEVEATRLYEEQFDYEYELINIRQVNSESDVPSGAVNSSEDEEASIT